MMWGRSRDVGIISNARVTRRDSIRLRGRAMQSVSLVVAGTCFANRKIDEQTRRNGELCVPLANEALAVRLGPVF